MEFRKLQKEEHVRTRALWEKIFTEDDKNFLDYYYKVKTAENEIFTAEEDGVIRSMIQLNPYQMHFMDAEILSHYIIAVATDANYRHQGLMAALLKMSMRQMAENGELFTFLMPAAEAIYLPFDFRYIYAQPQAVIGPAKEEMGNDENCSWKEAERSDAKELAAFAEAYLSTRYAVYAVRDEHYYEVMCQEQNSENGGIRVLRRDGRIAGCFYYDPENGCTVREPLILPGMEEAFQKEVRSMANGQEVNCRAYGDSKEKPLIMARILCLQKFLEQLKAREDLDFVIDVDDPILDENRGALRISAYAGEKLHTEKCIDSGSKISIALLVEILFGYVNPAQRADQITAELVSELGKIEPAKPVFLNEIV